MSALAVQVVLGHKSVSIVVTLATSYFVLIAVDAITVLAVVISEMHRIIFLMNPFQKRYIRRE